MVSGAANGNRGSEVGGVWGLSTGGEGYDFDARAWVDEGVGVVAGEDGLFVEFDDHGFSGEVEAF